MRVAIIENGVIKNIVRCKDDHELSQNEFNADKVVCNIGWPVLKGKPVKRPSKWHILDGKEWVITTENVSKKQAQEAEKAKTISASRLTQADLASIRGIREFLVSKFGSDELMPEDLVSVEKMAKDERKKLK